MRSREPYRIPVNERYFLDADGFCWREVVLNGETWHSMARVNPDNSPTPEPLLYLVPEIEMTWGAPWRVRLSYWLRPYWHATDTRVWRWQRKPCRYVVLPAEKGSSVTPSDGPQQPTPDRVSGKPTSPMEQL